MEARAEKDISKTQPSKTRVLTLVNILGSFWDRSVMAIYHRNGKYGVIAFLNCKPS
jgi:hypothetical protein